MSHTEQLTLWDEPEDILARFERRLHELRRPGLTLWTGALRTCWKELTGQRELALRQLDLAAYEVEQGREAAIILQRLHRARILLGAICTVVLIGAICLSSPDLRRPQRPARGQRPRLEEVVS
jgi:hypothetical protein